MAYLLDWKDKLSILFSQVHNCDFVLGTQWEHLLGGKLPGKRSHRMVERSETPSMRTEAMGFVFPPTDPVGCWKLPRATAMPSDHEALLALNRDYINSVQHSDVRRFDEILAEDFLCSNPDGSLIDRAAFLQQTAKPVAIRNLAAHDVVVRIVGDVALIHARTSYTLADGSAGKGRYTDVWAKRDGKWLAISAHVTRG
jgi:ketosteroid isomerase-like protein